MSDAKQERLWQRMRYRPPTAPVVAAYAEPKLDLVEKVISLGALSVLDVGCGPGLFTHFLTQRARLTLGVDLSPSMLRRCAPGLWCRADAGRLPFADDSFDVAFEANLLHHTDSPAQILSEMARVAREAVVVIEPNRLNPVMAGFSLLVRAERGGLRYSQRFLRQQLHRAGLLPHRMWRTGMISQNNTPPFLVPALRLFDVDFPLGEYHVCVAWTRRAPGAGRR